LDDILLLKAVNHFPGGVRSGQANEGLAADSRTSRQHAWFGVKKDGPACKSRFETIMALHRSNNQEALKKSGVAEEFNEAGAPREYKQSDDRSQ
jgi:transcriptional regulator NrdR family protein